MYRNLAGSKVQVTLHRLRVHVQVTAPLVNITIETTDSPWYTVLEHFGKRLGLGDTFNAVHSSTYITVTCSPACGKVTSILDPLQKFPFNVFQPFGCYQKQIQFAVCKSHRSCLFTDLTMDKPENEFCRDHHIACLQTTTHPCCLFKYNYMFYNVTGESYIQINFCNLGWFSISFVSEPCLFMN